MKLIHIIKELQELRQNLDILITILGEGLYQNQNLKNYVNCLIFRSYEITGLLMQIHEKETKNDS